MKRTSQTYRKSWILKSKKQREHLIISTQKRCWPRHTVSKLSKINNKERIVKTVRENKTATYKGKPIRLSSDFSVEILQARREWKQTFKLLKERNYQPIIINPANLFFRYEGEKGFPGHTEAEEIYCHKTSM